MMCSPDSVAALDDPAGTLGADGRDRLVEDLV
jgi:hypothetical protein